MSAEDVTRMNDFFGPVVPGQLGCMFDVVEPDEVVGHIGERVTYRCTPVHLGRQTHVWDAVVTNATTAKTMALFRCTQMVLHAR